MEGKPSTSVSGMLKRLAREGLERKSSNDRKREGKQYVDGRKTQGGRCIRKEGLLDCSLSHGRGSYELFTLDDHSKHGWDAEVMDSTLSEAVGLITFTRMATNTVERNEIDLSRNRWKPGQAGFEARGKRSAQYQMVMGGC